MTILSIRTNFILRSLTLAVLAGMTSCGILPTGHDKVSQDWTQLVVQAGVYLAELKKTGKLPGIPSGKHGKLSINSRLDGVDDLGKLARTKATFPFEVEGTATEESDTNSIYHYVVRKDSAEGPWFLVKAWKTDKKGTIVDASLPVPIHSLPSNYEEAFAAV